mgnify:CR=1 FL=1
MSIMNKLCKYIFDKGLQNHDREELIGNRGPQGPEGPKGETGEKGDAGNPGRDGIGINKMKGVYLIKNSSTDENGTTTTNFPKLAIIYDDENGEEQIQVCEFGIFEHEAEIYDTSNSFDSIARNILTN